MHRSPTSQSELQTEALLSSLHLKSVRSVRLSDICIVSPSAGWTPTVSRDFCSRQSRRDGKTSGSWVLTRVLESCSRLPSLAKLELSCNRVPVSSDFLPQLPLLKSLSLDCYKYAGGEGWHIPADALLASLLSCSCITELGLKCGFDSAQWSALFAKLRIRKLWMRGSAVKTLRCFAEGPITESLEELTLECRDLPPSEFSHLYALRRLLILQLDESFTSRLDDASIDTLTPPTALLPSLTGLVYRHAWCPEGPVKRHGPSAEWMQQRMTQ